MLSKKRLGFFLAMGVLLAAAVWMRSAFSWRLQKLGVWPKAMLLDEVPGGAWLFYKEDGLKNLQTDQDVVLPANFDGYEDSLENPIIFSPDSKSYAVFGDSPDVHNLIEWHDCKTGRLLRRFDLSRDSLWDDGIRFSPDGTQLVVLCYNGVRTLPLDGSPSTIFNFNPVIPPGLVALSRDGRWLVSGLSINIGKDSMATHCLKIFDVKKRRLIQTLRMKECYIEAIDMPSFSPDGKLFTYSFGDGNNSRRRVIDVQTGRTLWMNQDQSLLFAPDNRSAVVWSNSESLELREARTGRVLRVLPIPATLASPEMAFSIDGNSLYDLSKDDTLLKVRIH